jgi:23S rRNA pseudouridine955/2504/2580 synthase
MREFTIGKNDAGQRLDKFLQKAVPRLPQSLLYKSIRRKRIKLGGKRCEISTRLCEGDVLQLYLNDEFFEQDALPYPFLSAPAKVDVVYEDDNLLLADKKPGLLVHPDDENDSDTLIYRIQHYLYNNKAYLPETEHSFAPALCNRIDRNTGGIVLCAKNAQTLRVVNQLIKERALQKYYLCLVQGVPKPREGTLRGYLIKDAIQNKVTVHTKPEPDARRAVTRYRVLETREGVSLVEVELVTGRTHQIRAQFADRGYPLLGDGKYGKLSASRDRYRYRGQALYSYKLRFPNGVPLAHLDYLHGREFSVKDIYFLKDFYQSGA